MQETEYKFGSEWIRCDLHVHTPESLVNTNYGGAGNEPWEEFIADLENLPEDFKLLGINDYLFLDGYKKVQEYKKQGRLKNIDSIIPVIELRLAQFASSSGKWQEVNYHVVFSDELSAEDIETQFIGGLMADFQLSDSYAYLKERFSAAPTYKSLTELGKLIIDAAPEDKRKDFSAPLIEGFNNLVFERNVIEKLLQKSVFNNKTLTAIGKTEWDKLQWNDHSIASKKHTIQSVDFLFVSSENASAATNAWQKLKDQNVNDRLIDCSDSHYHSWSSNKDRLGNSFSWIRAKPSFEGIRQALYEYPARVRFSDAKPNEPVQRLDNFKASLPNDIYLKEEKFCFSGDYEFNFNPCFTCIIGGRGSGKSTLLQMVAKSYGASITNDIWDQTLGSLSSDGGPLQVTDFFETKGTAYSSEIEYIHQNAVEAFAQDTSKLKTAINNRVKKRVDKTEYEEIKEDLKSSHELSNEEINKVKETISLQKEKDSLSSQIKEKRSLIETVSDEKYREKQNKLDKSQQHEKELKKAYDKTSDALSGLKECQDRLDEVTSLENNPLASPAEAAKKYLEEAISELSKKEPWQRSNEQLKAAKDDATHAQHEIQKIFQDKGLDPESVTDVQTASSEIGPLEDRLSEIDGILGSFNEEDDPKRLCAENAKRLECYLDSVLESMVKELASSSDQVSDLQIVSERARSKAHEDWVQWLIEEIRKSNKEERVQEAKITEIFATIPLKDDLVWSDIDSALTSSSAQKASTQIREFLKDPSVFKIAQIKWNSLQTDVENYRSYRLLYNGRNIEDLSFGQRCTAVLVFLLKMGNTPVIIDEPEAHLDSLLIAKYLVELIKEKKQYRQIIFATHNANFVINGDADLIHHLEVDESGTTKVESFSIEDTENRQRLLGLEGGDRAFRLRATRYHTY
ncbi:AAA domain-containing protein, putative AbiEii toxin, Type IV TA system [Thiohalospira halophila DSM 15071]|uniref:AAA domain-containing protein, putative AbiEii toxin, Type IV TA system n=2 Tax=Thiohalospira halophila TaxID=381300 RepID=A0A1I1U663_9GAMM|nr:AAA domain-containing protein, putative AbiEii toxin, Type IV TA system [Thiohalospira halophila DSM 15071]